MKTHKIIDTVYHEDEDNAVFVGTYEECLNWMNEQGSFDIGYQILPMTTEELKIHNEKNQ